MVTYVVAVAPETFAQVSGTAVTTDSIAAEHRSHWYVRVGVGVPVAVPAETVNVEPTIVVPVTTGAAVNAGTLPTATVDAATVVMVPSVFVIVVRAVMKRPRSASAKVYDCPVSPAIKEHVPGSVAVAVDTAAVHRNHWTDTVASG